MSACVTESQRAGLHSNIRQDWATPWRLYEMLNREFSFSLDVCADASNAKTQDWFGSDALNRRWLGSCWCNPPYGREIGRWVEKAMRESLAGALVVMLLPARTDTQWFHAYCLGREIRFLRGRLTFDDTKRSRALFPSMVVVFRPDQEERTA